MIFRVTMNDDQKRAYDVLLVEDNPGDRRFIKEALQSSPLDLTVHTVKTRDEALDVVYQRGEYEDSAEPAVIMLDWDLSEETGKEVITAAKSRNNPIPVLVMTGSNPEIHPAKSDVSQADMFIEKPTKPEGYIEPLHSLLTGQ